MDLSVRLTKYVLALLVLVSFGACNKAATKKETNAIFKAGAEAIFPHTDEFKKSHGSSFQSDRQLCASCHGSDYSGGTAQVSCRNCHSAYPHAEGFSLPKNHGTKFENSSDKQGECFVCHTPEVSGPNQPPNCNQCHAAYPHTTDWKNRLNHGKAFAESKDRSSDCLSCHKNRVTTEKQPPNCTQCHAAFPHTGGFASPSKHGAVFVASTDKQTDCLKCHAPDLAGENRPIKCSSCHTAYPFAHDEDFFKSGGGEHGKLARTFEGKCTACHTDFKKNLPTLGDLGCSSCHTVEKFQINFNAP